jgi:hypothetical protein
MKEEVRVGDLAVCKAGKLGLVLKIEGHRKIGLVWSGIMIRTTDLGKQWQSLNPTKVASHMEWAECWPTP